MKSLSNFNQHASSNSILADEIVEFHVARLLLLFHICGINGQINGLTKMAKLDFFVRYPQFFNVASQALGNDLQTSSDSVESQMIRYHYGPWDHRYYHALAYLKSRGLLEIVKEGKAYNMMLTGLGMKIATQFESTESYASLIEHMRNVNNIFGRMNGSQLKNLVYKIFDEQIAKLKLGEVIR